jgi:hypothetical protein
MTVLFKKGEKIIFNSPVSLKISALSKIKARGVDAHPVHLKIAWSNYQILKT